MTSTSTHHRCNSPAAQILAAVALLLLTGTTSLQADPVTVYTRAGRSITGQVDARSNDQQLWLRVERPGIVLLRSFDRSDIESIETIAPPQAAANTNIAQIPTFTLRGEPDAIRPATALAPAEPKTLLASIAVEATVANWDADVEADGLILRLYPIDRDGLVVPIDGALEVELIGEGPGSTSQLRTFPTLGRWVRNVRADDFGAQAYTFKLEFQGISPDFDVRLGSFGLVHARLAAPGHGTFDASTDAVTLRTPNPMRDRLQQRDNWRYFPNERTGNSLQQQPQIPGL